MEKGVSLVIADFRYPVSYEKSTIQKTPHRAHNLQ